MPTGFVLSRYICNLLHPQICLVIVSSIAVVTHAVRSRSERIISTIVRMLRSDIMHEKSKLVLLLKNVRKMEIAWTYEEQSIR